MFIRRWIPRAVVAAVLGVASTVAVAWGIAMWYTWDPHRGIARVAPDGSAVANVRVDQAWQTGSIVRSVRIVEGPKEPWVRSVPESLESYVILERKDVDASWGFARRVIAKGQADVDGEERADGWPMVALYYQVIDGEPWVLRGAIEVSGEWFTADAQILPLFPVWRGLVVDTALYGAAWFGLLTIPVAVRARLRRRRGGCPECGYDLRGDWKGGCSECGWGKKAKGETRKANGM